MGVPRRGWVGVGWGGLGCMPCCDHQSTQASTRLRLKSALLCDTSVRLLSLRSCLRLCDRNIKFSHGHLNTVMLNRFYTSLLVHSFRPCGDCTLSSRQNSPSCK